MPRLLKTIWGAILLTATFLWIGTAPVYAAAVATHTFACTECHRTTQDPRPIVNFCIGCHTPGGTTVGGMPIAPVDTFVAGDASNAGGDNPTLKNDEISHFWGPTSSTEAAAGSKNPPSTFYTSRYSTSTGKVTCTICHDPHLDNTVAPFKQLRASTADDVICKQCHVPFYQDYPYANLTHPVGPTVVLGADPLKFNSSVVNIGNGNVRLITGPLGTDYVSCTSCHGNHFTDSDSTSPDGADAAIAGQLQPGDGFLLRTDGPRALAGTPQQIADKRSAICTACHPYKTHGNDTEPVGCLVCHSAHVYNGTIGPYNNFVLRSSATTTAFGTVTGLNYTAAPPVAAGSVWADATASAVGYCEKCHGDLLDNGLGKISKNRTHNTGENCKTCHVHHKADATRSFQATGCDTCHGNPPAVNVAVTGYAAGYPASGVFKDESSTPHAAHSGSGSTYKFSCGECHNAFSDTTHNKGTFQDVLITDGAKPNNGFSTLVRPVGSGLNPTYTITGPGTCSATYCHSNGGKFNASGKVLADYKTVDMIWDNGPAIGTCDACHGNTVASMGAAQRNNSQSHNAHLTRYANNCSICHVSTATTNLLLTGTAGTHVNGTADVAFSATFELSAGHTLGAASYTGASCSVYCHSNGGSSYAALNKVATTWATTTAGDCGYCHGARVGDLAVISSGSHTAHISAANGPKLSCSACHDTTLLNDGTHAKHVNGTVDLIAGACASCHGIDGAETAPTWGLSNTVKCETCHTGSSLSTIGGQTAPNKSTALTSGHGRATAYNVSGNPAANKACTACHNSAAAGHFDATTGDTRLLASAATCTTSCHGVSGSAASKGLVTHQGANCNVCHDPHGTSNIYMVNTTSASYSGTVAFTTLSGPNSYDEVDSANGDDICATCHTAANQSNQHNNKTNAGVAHNEGTDCFSCHKPHTDAAPFGKGAGDSCKACHAAEPTSAAHAKHISVATIYHDATNGMEDLSDCAACHLGADLYTYDQAADRDSGVAGRLNHGANKVTPGARAAVLASAVGYTGTNCTNACHDGVSGKAAVWTATSLACDACHYQSATPTLLGNNNDVNPLGGNHSTHFAAGAICTKCHANVTDMTHVTTPLAGTDLAKIQGRATALQDEATLAVAALGTGSDPDPGNPTCNNVGCHNPSNTTYSATWNTANGFGCDFCHSKSDPGTGSHTQHLNAGVAAGGAFGKNIVCTNCHVNNGTNTAHRNNLVNLTVGLNYTPGAETIGGTVGNCNTSTCHNTGTAAATPKLTPTWGNAPSDTCATCHDNGPTTGKHGGHVNATYVGTCTNCHTAASASSHINGTRNMASSVTDMDLVTAGNQLTAPAVWAGTCTNSCHIANTANDWTAGTLACTDCHGSTKSVDKGWPPAGDAHGAHLGVTAYVNANCTDCHGDNSVTHSVLDGNPVVAGTNVTTYNGDGTCVNKCHAGGDFDTPVALACANCHTTGTYLGSGTKLPTSGLHNATIAVNHGATMGCTECHSATPTTSHLNGGALQNSAATTYNFGAKVNSYSAANGCAATCHADAVANGGVGKWSRRWNGAVNAKPAATDDPGAAVCDNCHGDGVTAGTTTVDNVWRTGLIPAHLDSPDTDPGIKMLAQHGNCKSCHGYGDASYNKTWGIAHGDGNLRMNGPSAPLTGAAYDQANHGCLAACHAGSLTLATDPNYNHTMADSGWTIDFADYGSGDCNTCHAAAGRDHSGTNESLNTHNLHIESGYITSDCTECHPHDGQTVAPGTGVHAVGDNTVNFANKIPSTFNYTGTDFAGGCATNTCHNTDGTTEWKLVSLGGDACADCHDSGKTGIFTTPTLTGSAPTSGAHALHLANTAVITNCAECHGNNGTLSSVAPFNNHIDQSVAIDGVQLTSYTNPSCTNSCHALAGSAGAVTWAAASTPLACADCHNKVGNTLSAPISATLSTTVGPTGDKHLAHTTADTDYVANCATCHNHSGALHSFATTGHVNGVQKSLVGTITVNGDKSCTNSCHLAASVNEWTSGTLVCTDCHTQATKTLGAGGDLTMSATVAPNTGKHTVHMANNTYVPSDCTSCHSHSGALGAAGHVNGPTKTSIEVANSITVSPIPADDTCTNNCHKVAVASNWLTGTLLCADCHNADANVADLGTFSLDQGNWPPSSNTHTDHIVSNALGGAGNAAQNDCYACHNSTVTSAGVLLAGIHANGTPTIAFNSAFGYQGVVATKAVAGVNQSCASVLCHNGATTPLWNAASIACGDCHGTPATDNPEPTGANVAGSHGPHSDAVITTYVDCAKCHNGAATYTAIGGTNHQNLAVNLFGFTSATSDATGNNTYTDTTEGGVNYQAADATHVDNGTCSNIDCHMNTAATWGAAQTAIPARCDNCHNDGTPDDTMSSSAPATGEHVAHIAANTSYVDDCVNCHGAGANTGIQTGHGNLTLDLNATVISIWDNTNNTCTNNCHLASSGDWDNDAPIVSGTLVCDDCHNAGAGHTLNLGAALTATVPPNTGEHNDHDASPLVGTCTDCHPHSGALGNNATTKHVNGTLVTSIDIDGVKITDVDLVTVGNQTQTLAAWAGNCANTCHAATRASLWNGAMTLTCAECHTSSGKSLYTSAVWPPTSNKHPQHIDVFAPAYGDAVNHSTAAQYDFGCGSCHGNTAANHANGTLNVTVTNWTPATKTCGQNSCHQDGNAGPPLVTADWDAVAPTQNCNLCHGNSPNTGAHSEHTVGIHYQDIYTGTTGRATVGNTTSSSHGNSATSSTINCNLCHSTAMTVSYNAANTVCAGCHSDTNTPATGFENAVIADKSVHVNGTPNVVFANVSVKSKAQLRDNLADAGLATVWTRTGTYKTAGSFDQSVAPLFGTASYAANTCSAVACHNGNVADWATPVRNDCMSCHTSLPK